MTFDAEATREKSLTRRAAEFAGDGAVIVGVGVFRLARWLKDNTVVGLAGPPDGRSYGPHEDLTEPAYVRDRHGNVRPYRP